MNFKLPAIDAADTQRHQNPIHHFRHSFRAGFQNGNGFPHGNDREPFEMRDAIQREIEKERIRAEIIAEEMARRRVLENEVRNELMMERQMAMRSAGGFSSQASHSDLFEARILNSQPVGLEERIIMAIDEKNRFSVSPFQQCGGSVKIKEICMPQPEDSKMKLIGSNRCEDRGILASPFQRCGDSVKIKEISTHLPEANKKQVIVLGKPIGETLSGTKRKSTPAVGGESNKPHLDCSKKQVKEEWSCAICQVSATSERGLNDHLQGKKHQAKEENLIAEKSGANFGLGVSPMKPIVKPVRLTITTVNLSSSEEQKCKIKTEFNRKRSAKSNKTLGTSDSNDTKKEDAKSGDNKRDKFKFWCEMCQVGTHSEKVMNTHKEGKKHMTHLVQLHRKGKVELEASDIEKTCDIEEKTKTGTKASTVEMVSAEDNTETNLKKIVVVNLGENMTKKGVDEDGVTI